MRLPRCQVLQAACRFLRSRSRFRYIFHQHLGHRYKPRGLGRALSSAGSSGHGADGRTTTRAPEGAPLASVVRAPVRVRLLPSVVTARDRRRVATLPPPIARYLREDTSNRSCPTAPALAAIPSLMRQLLSPAHTTRECSSPSSRRHEREIG